MNVLRIAGARSAEQSGIKGVKIPFDPNISVRSIAQGAGRDKWETDGTGNTGKQGAGNCKCRRQPFSFARSAPPKNASPADFPVQG